MIGEVDDIQEGFDLGIVGHGDASAPAWRSIPTVASIGAVAPVVSVGRSDPPRPPRPPLPPDPPGPPSALTVSEPPRGSTRYSFGWPTADTLTSRRAWLPDLRVRRTCTGGASPPAPPSWPFEPSPPREGLFGSVEPMLPLVPFSPSLPLEPLLPETSIMKLWLYRMGISRSVRRPGWLGTVTVTCATFPSLTLGSPGRDAIPLLIDGHDTGRYFEVLPHHLSLA